uniref:Alpha/beta hydrolase fold-3 domain-containing protein n=1 Tax=Kwoniella dejecticola CBS 10117 TaxID=1296121 RepID=A0A1A6A133_9TREE|nr:uncharacterized protein I303_06058 [Kwoniella dejecticola CBS 10117]OBR83776.1 hypothetical protein I303_06058 [Kwoniella dejecticola CBS 10117]
MTVPSRLISPCPTPFSDHIVDTVEGVDIPIRVFPGPSTQDAKLGKKPWLFWIHGGGWVGGKHLIPNSWIYPAFHALPLGLHIICVSYRFIPQVTLPQIYSDLVRSFQWCLTNLTSILGPDSIDVGRYVIGGDSAGGQLSSYCALALDGHFLPRPLINLNIYGSVDLADPHLSTPFDKPLPFNTPLKILQAAARDSDARNAKVTCPWVWELPPQMDQSTLQDFWGSEYTPTKEDEVRMDLNTHYVRTGTRIKALFGFCDQDEAEKSSISTNTNEWDELVKSWSPLHCLKNRKKKKKKADGPMDYPPTVIMHGDDDTIVPIQQSIEFADQLEELGVAVKRIWCKGGGHCFEQAIGVSRN